MTDYLRPPLALERINSRSAGTVELVLLMYDMLLDTLRRAGHLLSTGDGEPCATAIQDAITILDALQATLTSEDGHSAKTLDAFYSVVRSGIQQAHARGSLTELQKQVLVIAEVRDAWDRSGTHDGTGEYLGRVEIEQSAGSKCDAVAQAEDLSDYWDA
jgi:flagellar biosynthetic protein FliS